MTIFTKKKKKTCNSLLRLIPVSKFKDPISQTDKRYNLMQDMNEYIKDDLFSYVESTFP